mmetsp:Transcript_48495/g.140483  ORF Transcript_48495/g.140483 Transcript_48495/m.140483 type:complete len:322 (-) Transcript_48495:132-1097(-)
MESEGAKREEAAPLRERWRPGRVPAATLACCLATSLLDAMCFLPHPHTGLTPRVDVEERRGLPAHEVRRQYHEQLSRWASQVRDYLGNETLLQLELPRNTSGPLGGSPICLLAARCVVERRDARSRTRLMGSSLAHSLLIARDWWVYGSDAVFTPEAMMASRRAKMEAKGLKPTDDEVCRAVVDSSTRTNKDYDEAAKALEAQQQSYVTETFLLYLWPSLPVVTTAYLLQLAAACLRKDGPPSKGGPSSTEAAAGKERDGAAAGAQVPVKSSKAKARGAAALGLGSSASQDAAPASARRRSGTPGAAAARGERRRGGPVPG